MDAEATTPAEGDKASSARISVANMAADIAPETRNKTSGWKEPDGARYEMIVSCYLRVETCSYDTMVRDA